MKQTVTFVAPVELNGTRGNVAVVINRKGSHYYAHRIVLPDGTTFKFSQEIKKENAAQELPRGVTVSGSLADATSAASINSIRREGQKSQEVFTFAQRNARRGHAQDRSCPSGGNSLCTPEND